MPVAALTEVSIAFGHLPLLDHVALQIDPGERVSLVGRNGTGKSTLLQVLSGELAPDAGNVWFQPALRIARLTQDVPLATDRAVVDVVAEGLGEIADLVTSYHHVAHQVAEASTPALLDQLGELQHELERRDGWRVEERVDLVLSRLGLPAEASVATLSGGWRRRVLLARALVAQPDLLLLDEPTNHLDLEAITWLEDLIADYPGAVVFVTHDRAFLQRLATRIVEIDRGRLTSWPGDYATYLQKKEESLVTEALHQEKFDKKLAEEEVWLRQGVKARRTRNEGRVKALMEMRAERAARRGDMGTVRLEVEASDPSGRMVIEAKRLGKSFGVTPVVRDFSIRVVRGDRIGLIGSNGAGKTTLLRLLLGELPPDTGIVRQGANVQVAYYDQQREQLDPERTVFETVGDGNDTVTVAGRSRHVNAYLSDFLFPPARAQSPVKALSGGERNRLLLARLFTRPANLLVLDEPTNDLDLETLELLEAELVRWPGTLLLVSHDRVFLDNVVTSTLVFEGEGRVQEYVGGYEDWVRQRDETKSGRTIERTVEKTVVRAPAQPDAQSRKVAVRPTGVGRGDGRPLKRQQRRTPDPTKTIAPASEPHAAVASDATTSSGAKKLSYRERRELEELPAKIEALETEQRTLSAKIAEPGFYKETAATIASTLERVEVIGNDLGALYARWNDLDSRPR
jgi:ATP-binding cassette subfamily F protein uup